MNQSGRKLTPEAHRRTGITGVRYNALVATAMTLMIFAGPAYAASTHPYDAGFVAAFNTGGSCEPSDVATDPAGNLYVACRANGGSIRKFAPNGSPSNFSTSEPYVSGNTITENPDPATTNSDFGEAPQIAIDNSSAHPGFIYVTGGGVSGYVRSPDLEIFDPSGKWLGSIVTPSNFGLLTDVGLDNKGFIYEALTSNYHGHVEKYDPLFHSVSRLAGAYYAESSSVAPDSTGGVWTIHSSGGGNPPGPLPKPVTGGLYYFESSQFTTHPPEQPVDALPASFANPFKPANESGGIAVDLRSDDLYLDRGGTIETYSHGTEEEPPFKDGPDFGEGHLVGSKALAIDGDGNVYATSGTEGVVKFDTGSPLPNVETAPPSAEGIGHTTATLRGHVALAGGGPITDCELEWGTDTSYSGTPVKCSPDAISSNYLADTAVSANLVGLTTGATYHYRFVAANAAGKSAGRDRTFIAAAVIKLQTGEATSVTTHSAVLHGSFDPDGESTSYYFEYGLGKTYGQKTPLHVIGASPGGVTPVESAVAELQSGKTYHYRIVARNGLGTTYGNDVLFRTASGPEILGATAKNVTATTAELFAQVNPTGFETTYRFEYGPTPSYGTVIPEIEASAGSADTPQAVHILLTGLEPGIVYHFQIVATNRWGTTTSLDNTFSFYPPSCPNAHLRQVTKSEYLPDCRAYELVSPGNADGTTVFPSDESIDVGGASFGFNEIYALAHWPQNTGLAEAPARFAFYGGVGAMPGTNPPNALIDQYVSTRTPSGWVTTFPGLPGNVALLDGRPVCSNDLSRCVDHDAESAFTGEPPDESAHLFDVSGSEVGVLPSNIDEVNGRSYEGDQHPSGDFSHFVFSSNNVAFAPGGSTSAPGTVYDENLKTGEIALVSKLPGGADIPQDSGGPSEFIQIPAVSTDGSHILMQTEAPGGLVHLYMSIDDAAAIDIAEGAAVRYVGMTSNGDQVLFTTAAPLNSADHDSSVDLYRWTASDNQLSLLSKGNGQGDTDECFASWTAKCDVKPLEPKRAGDPSFPKRASIPGLDNLIASDSGAVYFYSPENLDQRNPGIPGQRNLYLAREGAVQFVATFDPGTQVDRMQISPDGIHAALLTRSQLTGYDNAGFEEMYTYDAETGAIRCASCNVDGTPPHSDVSASQGGPFMSNDGRAFFSTSDSLVPQDSDGIVDVYEFVNGRPQLISSGVASRDEVGGSIANYFFPAHKVGLESVSASGTDVFFTTFDSLVPQDENGPFVKVYDARTGGGFPPLGAIHPCAAADECHGVGAEPAQSPSIATGQVLGESGTARPEKKRHRRHHRHRQRRHRRHSRGGHHG